MIQLAEDVWQIPLMPRHAINAYLLGDVLVDAGTKGHGKKVVKAVAGRGVTAHAATHAHPDHVGGSRQVLQSLGVPFWIGAADAPAAEDGRSVTAQSRIAPIVGRTGGFPAVTVDRRLQEGDELTGGFVVLDVPGHSAGHVAFWRERDRVLVAGDVFFNMHLLTLQPGLRHPPAFLTVDPELNRASQRKLADLGPELVLFGHGPPLRDAGALARFAGSP